MSQVWGSMDTDYIPKRMATCARCSQRRYKCANSGYICAADCDIKYYYTNGRTQDAIALLRGLPSDLLKDYLSEKSRTPSELKAVILDELQQREKEDKPRL